MQFLLLADLHYSLKQLDWLMAVAPDYDVVVIAGDHLDISSHVDGRTQIVVVLKYLERLRRMTRLVVSSGNHDLDARNADGEKTADWLARVRELGIVTDGGSLVAGDYLITVCPWWDGPVSRRHVDEQLALDAKREKGTWAWVYHGPPAGSPTSWDGLRCFGDPDLAEWIAELAPDIVVCGHVHNSPFAKSGSWADRIGRTWVFNPGYEISPTPPHIVLSTDSRTAVWRSSAGVERVCLDEPLRRPLAKVV